MKKIPLTKTRWAPKSPKTPFALVDDEDHERCCKYEWKVGACGDAFNHIGLTMHRFILNLKVGDGLHGHHVNRNRLDNRRSNLLAVTPAQHGFLHRGQRRKAAAKAKTAAVKRRAT